MAVVGIYQRVRSVDPLLYDYPFWEGLSTSSSSSEGNGRIGRRGECYGDSGKDDGRASPEREGDS